MIELRQEKILKLLNENGYMEVTDLASKLNVSVATIRRDLDFLEKEGKCLRKHGGGMINGKGFMFEVPYVEKEQSYIEEKKKIAEIAVTYIHPGDALILDSGSTVFQMVYFLQGRDDLTVVTNDIKTAFILASNSKISLYVPGGAVLPGVFTVSGSKSVEWFEHLHVNTLFLGADAILSDGRIMNYNESETRAKQAMVNAADKVVVMATSDKFTRNGFLEVLNLRAADVLITDEKISSDTLEWLRSFNIEIRIAHSGSGKKGQTK